jgi:hypothetical protein
LFSRTNVKHGLKVLTKKKFALSHGFIIGGLILLSAGLALSLGPIIHGIVGLIIAGIWCFAGGLCFVLEAAFTKLIAKK